MNNGILRIVTVICAAVLLLSVTGVYATWQYSQGATVPETEFLKLDVFPWTGSEELPDDVSGEDHKGLIENILNGTITNSNGQEEMVGLNNPNSYLNNEIEERSSGWFSSDTLGSMDYWQDENINNYFDMDTHGLSFLLYFPNGVSNTYYLFTTSVKLGEANTPNIPIGEYVYPVYRTILKKNSEGIWEATETKVGYSPSAYYDNVITGSWLLKYPSFSPTGWREGELGTNTGNAIYMYIGQTATAYPDSKTEKVYYEVVPKSAMTLNVSCVHSNVVINVYNASGALVTATDGAQGSNNISFSAAQNTSYYIEISGDKSMTFTVKQVT